MVYVYHQIIICALLRNKALQVSLWTKHCNSMALLRWWFAFGESRLAMTLELCSLFHDFPWPCWICSICLHGHFEVELNHKSGSICYAAMHEISTHWKTTKDNVHMHIYSCVFFPLLLWCWQLSSLVNEGDVGSVSLEKSSTTEDYAVGGGVTEEAMGIAKTLWKWCGRWCNETRDD